jgi:hypothetical protein
MSVENLAIHVVSFSVNGVERITGVKTLYHIPVTSVTRRLVEFARQCSGVLLIMIIVNGSVAAAVRKTYSLGQTNHVLTVATSTVTIIWYFAALVITMAHAAINVESSEL